MTADAQRMIFLLNYQRGVLTRTQALASGISANGLQHRLRRGGPWRRLLPGVYATFTGAATAEQLEIAALLYAGEPAVLTGPAALRNFRIRGPAVSRVDVLVPAERRPASRGYVTVHRTWRMPAEITLDGARQFAPPARAVADTVRALTDLPQVRNIVGSAVQLHRCTIDELSRELAEGPVRASRLLRAVLVEVADGVRSAAEGRLREIIAASSLPTPLYNPDLFVSGEFLARPDAWWPESGVAAEVDSREFHFSPEDWEKTMRRHRRIEAAGIRVLHLSPRQVEHEPQQILRDIADALKTGRPLPWITTRPAAA
jgi:hypothetical protein